MNLQVIELRDLNKVTLQITPWIFLRLWSTKICEYYFHETQKCFCSQSWRPQSKTLTEFCETGGETVYKCM